MRNEVRESDDRGVLNAAVIASLLTAVLVELRHRHLVAVVAHEHDVRIARVLRTRFLLETWMLTGVCLLVLLIAQGGFH
jgi:hypothetical protein